MTQIEVANHQNQDYEPTAGYEYRLAETVASHEAAIQHQLTISRDLEDRTVRSARVAQITHADSSQVFGDFQAYRATVTAVVTGQLAATQCRLQEQFGESSVDERRWQSIRQSISQYGLTHVVLEAIRMVASPYSRRALRTAIDLDVWHRLRSDLAASGPNAGGVLVWASSPGVAAFMADALDSSSLQRVTRQANRHRMMRYLAGELYNQVPPDTDKQVAAGFLIQLYIAHQQGGALLSTPDSTLGQPPRSASGEAAGRDLHTEARALLASLAPALPREFHYVLREDPAEIQRVMDDVRRLRAHASERGETASDKDIYLSFQRATDRPVRDTDPQTLHSFKILQGLMGGNLNGKLPF